MKNQIAIAALTFGAIFLGTNNVQAQKLPAPATAKSTVNIILSDVITIDPTSVAITEDINFTYAVAADYYNEQTKNISNALKVTSTRAFGITVQADGPNFENTAASSTIPVGVMTITPNGGNITGQTIGGILSETAVDLVTNAALGSELTLGLKFTIPAAKAKSTDILGKAAGTYTQKVTYTATAI